MSVLAALIVLIVAIALVSVAAAYLDIQIEKEATRYALGEQDNKVHNAR